MLDPHHRLVKLAKATITPQAVVMGKNGEVLYSGRIDDLYTALGKRRATPPQHDLRDALDAITAGKRVKKRATTAIGCQFRIYSSDIQFARASSLSEADSILSFLVAPELL